MSRFTNNKSANKKPFCKVCQDAGKPESEYTSHWVRSLPDRTGKTTVLCPTLMSTECRYCFKLGHTAKFCPVIEKNKKDKERLERKAQFEAVKPVMKAETKRSVSGFAALAEDSDSEYEEGKVRITDVVEDFPVLNTNKTISVTLPKTEPDVKSCWAAVLAKPKEEKYVETAPIPIPQKSTNSAPVVVIPIVSNNLRSQLYTRNWADWTDSDSDEDEQEVSKPVAVEYDSDW